MLDDPNRNQNGGPRAKSGAQVPGAAALFNGFGPTAAYAQFWNYPGLKVSQKIAESWLSFLGKRWAKDLAFQKFIVQCKTAEDFGAAYSEFLQQAATDYSAEFNDLANATWTAARATFHTADGSCDSKGCGSCGNKHS